jgi:hypothetical protein
VNLWVSCQKFTIGVRVEDHSDVRRITDAAPIARKFIGQPVTNLLKWAGGFGGLRIESL